MNLSAQDPGGSRGFGAPDFLDTLDRHTRLFPRALTLSALSERQAQDAHAISARGVESDRASGSPHKIRRVGADHEYCFPIRHESMSGSPRFMKSGSKDWSRPWLERRPR